MDRPGVHHLGPRRLLTSVVLTTALLLPASTLDSLQCYYRPLIHKEKTFGNRTARCMPGQRCGTSRGHYGQYHALSGQGCFEDTVCGSHEMVRYRGIDYNVSYTCCCQDHCNSPPTFESILKQFIGMVKALRGHSNITQGLREWDSCANYTSVRTTTLPAKADRG